MNQNVLKGLLIILVIFDHNEYAHKIFPQFLAGFSFHVIGFLALPFLRPADQTQKNTLEKMAFSYYYPFFLVVCGMALITMLMSQHITVDSFQKLLLALYSGNSNILKSVTQMSLLWFLPSFFSLMLMRRAMADQSKITKISFLIITSLMHIVVGSISSEIPNYIPLGLLPIIYAIPLILIIIISHQRVFEGMKRLPAIIILSAAFSIVKYWQIRMGLNQELGFAMVSDYKNIPALIVNDLEAVTGTLMLFQLARFNFCGLIEKFGQNSMQVYLLHAFIALGIFKVLEEVQPNTAMSWRLAISMSLTIIISYFVAKSVMENTLTKRLFFPKNWRELTQQNHSHV